VDRTLSHDDTHGEATGSFAFRRPVAADHATIVDRVDDWWGGSRVRPQLPRLWFEHFTGTSWVAEEPNGRIVGFLVAFIRPDDRATGYIHMIGIDPNRRRRGTGRALYERAFDDLRGHGADRVLAVAWPGNRIAIMFHRALGFAVDDGPGTTPVYGTPARVDQDGAGEDRVVFVRDL
jgi:ribosomal protein S18 acetylase RimI-like enzyme